MTALASLLTCGLLAAILPGGDPAVPARSRPNVLLIAVDDLNDWVGCLGGHPQVKTPRIDELARRGTLFTNAHCQSPLCNPSRTSFLTGKRPSTTGVYALLPYFRSVPELADLVTIPQHFASNGYRTFVSGKILHDLPLSPEQRSREFQVWGERGPMPYPPAKFVTTPNNMKPMDWGVFPEDDRAQADWKIADSAIEHLRSIPDDQPFFVSVGFRLPHVPCFASRPWFDLYPEDDLILPPVKDDDRDDVPGFAWYLHWKLPEPRLSWLREANQWRPLVRAYLASTSFMDSQVGRVLDALEQTGKADNTVVVLFSDHGWHLGEKGISGKNTLWERSTRVPLIVAGPGVTRGARCVRPAELLDLYPTLSELCGLIAPEGLEGHSLVPQLRDATAPRAWPAITTHNRGNHSVRTERWRYIRYADDSEELYDLAADPNEWTNLIGDPAHAELAGELKRQLPATDAPPVPGSQHRLLIRSEDGRWIWEGEPIDPAQLER